MKLLNADHVEDSNSSIIFIVSGALGGVIIILLLTMGVFAIRFSFKKNQFSKKSKYQLTLQPRKLKYHLQHLAVSACKSCSGLKLIDACILQF